MPSEALVCARRNLERHGFPLRESLNAVCPCRLILRGPGFRTAGPPMASNLQMPRPAARVALAGLYEGLERADRG